MMPSEESPSSWSAHADSVMLASLGWALIWQSGPSFAIALALIPFFRAKAKREERWLREQFHEYANYERRVPPFVPRFLVHRHR
jgi:protein-S-isoprenylcysteine O-methyltransferase Ste14